MTMIARMLKGALEAMTPRDTAPAGGIVYSRRHRFMRKGSSEVLAAYSHSPLVRTVAHKVAHTVAAQKWFVTVNGEPVEDHPALAFLERGQPLMDALRRDVFMQLTEDLVGEACAMIGTTGANGRGEPVRLYAFPPTWIHEVPTAERDSYVIRTPHTGGSITVPRSQIYHRKATDPLDPYGRGSGIGGALADEISVDEAAAQHMASTLQNNARPDLIITGGENSTLDAAQAERLRARFEEHRGPGNAGVPMIAASPLTVKEVSQSFADMALVDIRQFELDTIITTWGIPPEVIGKIENSNRATIDAADHLLLKHTVVPRLMATRAALNMQIAGAFGDGVEFDFVNPVSEDHERSIKVMTAFPHAFTIDEVRATGGHEPLPDGQGKVIARSPLFEYVPVAGDDAVVQTRAAKALTVKASIDDVDAALRELDDTTALETLFRAILSDVVADFGTSALAGIGIDIDFSLSDPRVVNWLADASSSRVTMINETTRSGLRRTLSQGVDAGETTDQLVARIQSQVEGASVSRANTIARTEIVRGSNFATTEGHRQAGVLKREWLAVQGVGVGYEFGQVRPSHHGLDQIVSVGIDEPFVIPMGHDNSGASAMYPGDFGIPEEDINCRCGVAPILDVKDATQRLAMFKSVEDQRAKFERQFAPLMLRALTDQLNRVAQELKKR